MKSRALERCLQRDHALYDEVPMTAMTARCSRTFPTNVLYFRFGSTGEQMTQGTVQIVAGVLAVILIAIVFLRRKGKKKTEEDDF